MDHDYSTIELELLELQPSPLSPAFLDRLENALSSRAADQQSDSSDESSPAGLDSLESSLRGLAPHGMPEDMLSRLDQAMSRWHENVPVEEKVVPMHTESGREKKSWFGYRAVAAAAVMGAAAAFTLAPEGPQGLPQASQSQSTLPSFPTKPIGAVPANFSPGQSQSSLISTDEKGIIWSKQGTPMRVISAEYQDRKQFLGKQGEVLTIEKPKREIIVIPMQVD